MLLLLLLLIIALFLNTETKSDTYIRFRCVIMSTLSQMYIVDELNVQVSHVQLNHS